jgi:hypothetical protein
VQQCGVRSTHAVLSLGIPKKAPVQNLHSFAGWLRKHAHLLQTISVRLDIKEKYTHNCTLRLADAEPAGQLMQRALEAAAAAVPPATADSTAMTSAAAAAAAAQGIGGTTLANILDSGLRLSSHDAPKQQQQPQQRGLQLASFSTNCLVFPGVLSALPAHSLTHLDLDLRLFGEFRAYGYQQMTDGDGPAVSAALAQLSSLRQLHISNGLTCLPNSCLAGVAQLKHLTLLELKGRWQHQAQHSFLQLPCQNGMAYKD